MLNRVLRSGEEEEEEMEKEQEVEASGASTDKTASHSMSPESGSDNPAQQNCNGNSRPRKKHRRGRKRKWKPYSKMTVEERKELEQREAARAARKEAGLVGRPAAPWNTTQFIMEDRGEATMMPDPLGGGGGRRRTLSRDSLSCSEGGGDLDESSDGEGGGGEDEMMKDEHSLFLEHDFQSIYQQMAAERLEEMGREELVQEYLELEQRLEMAHTVRVTELESELRHLKAENCRLQEENKELKDSSGTAVSC